MIAGAERKSIRRPDRRAPLAALAVLAIAFGFGTGTGPLAAATLVASCAASWLLVPAVARFARRSDACVLPGGRSVHKEPTPLLGGLAIYVPVVVVLVVAGGSKAMGLALAGTMMAAVGVVDDVQGVSPRLKIVAQLLAGLVLIGAGYRLPTLRCPPFFEVATGGFEVPLVLFWVVLATNAINLIDGLDGLAAGIAAVGALACALLGSHLLATLALLGGLLGFLRHNMPPARIFLGDAGSLFVGFTLAALLLDAPAGANLPVALGVLALPLGDVAFSAARRWLRGKPIFAADRGHVHHVLLHFWGDGGAVVAALAGCALLQAASALYWPNLWGLLGACTPWAAFGAYYVARKRPRWSRILHDRRGFQRAHLVRRYAQDAIRLAESPPDVAGVLQRVATDFHLVALKVRDIELRWSVSAGAGVVVEQVDCGESCAHWSYVPNGDDPTLIEEKRSILCDLLRCADARLADFHGGVRRRMLVRVGAGDGLSVPAVDPKASAMSSDAPGPGTRRPRIHFVVSRRADLERIDPLVEETRRRGALEPAVIHAGRRDDLDPEGSERTLLVPDIDLDVAPTRDAAERTSIMERYDALLDTGEPSLVVVVGESSAAVAGARVAKRRNIPVAHLDGGILPQESPAAAAPGRAGEIVPALEALVGARSGK